MIFDLPPQPKLWLPERPAIIQPSIVRPKKFEPFAPAVIFIGGAATKTLTFQARTGQASSASEFTFSTVTIGTAEGSRRVIVGVSGGTSSEDFVSVVIGGVTATQVGVVFGGTTTVGFYVAHVPTGTTANIVVTWVAAQGRCGISVWTATGLSADAANHFGSSTADPATFTLNTLAGGFAVGYMYVASASTTHAWTNLTEQFDETTGVGQSHSGAHNAATSAGTLAVTDDQSSSSTNRGFVCASW